VTVVHVGTTKKYAAGWESIFGGSKKAKAPAAAKSGKKKSPPAAKSAKKKAAPQKKKRK
jgi:hypothetical protein